MPTNPSVNTTISRLQITPQTQALLAIAAREASDAKRYTNEDGPMPLVRAQELHLSCVSHFVGQRGRNILQTYQQELSNPLNCRKENRISQQAGAIAKSFPRSLAITARYATPIFSVFAER
jgi:hypothetical protein